MCFAGVRLRRGGTAGSNKCLKAEARRSKSWEIRRRPNIWELLLRLSLLMETATQVVSAFSMVGGLLLKRKKKRGKKKSIFLVETRLTSKPNQGLEITVSGLIQYFLI